MNMYYKAAAWSALGLIVMAFGAGCVADSGAQSADGKAPIQAAVTPGAGAAPEAQIEQGSATTETPPVKPGEGSTGRLASAAPAGNEGAAPPNGQQPAPKIEQAGSPTAAKLVPGVPVKLNPVSRIPPSNSATMVAAPRLGSAVYRCGGGRSMTIDNRRSSVTLLDPDGETMLLPASPPGQVSRYGKKPYALVLEGGEALYVKPRKPPFTCKR